MILVQIVIDAQKHIFCDVDKGSDILNKELYDNRAFEDIQKIC